MKITFDRKTADYILGVFEGTFQNECVFCGDEITEKNLGIVIEAGFGCSNLFCLIEYTEKLLKTRKEK